MDFGDYFQNGFESGVNKLFRRGCVECPPAKLECPVCAPGEVCSQATPSCKHCSSRTCVPDALSGLTSNSSPSHNINGGPNIGAIVGGVVGGVVFIAIATWLVWRFCIKARRQQWQDEFEQDYAPYAEKRSSGGYAPSPNPNRAVSTRTRQSVASTAYTRGSNVIQIAFIPGITDRAEDSAGFIPPVPPIPAATSPVPQSPQSPYTDYSEDHYFMPGDLRDSTYSGFTDDGASTIHRQSTAPSIAPSLLRQSVASTLYRGDNPENLAPAQTALRGRPLMVSVKSSANTSRSVSVSVPAVPQIDYEKYRQPQSTMVGDVTAHNKQAVHSNSAIPIIQRESASDADETRSIASGSNDLKLVIEEATRQASRQPVHGGLGSVKSPFSDDARIPSSDAFFDES